MTSFDKVFSLPDQFTTKVERQVPNIPLAKEFVLFLQERSEPAAQKAAAAIGRASFTADQVVTTVVRADVALVEQTPHCLPLPQGAAWKLKDGTAPVLVNSIAPRGHSLVQASRPPVFTENRFADGRPKSLEWTAIRSVLKDFLKGLGERTQSKRLYKTWILDFIVEVVSARLDVAAKKESAFLECEQIAFSLKILGNKAYKALASGLVQRPDLPERLAGLRDRHRQLLQSFVKPNLDRYRVPHAPGMDSLTFGAIDLSNDEDMRTGHDGGLEGRIETNLRAMTVLKTATQARVAKERLDHAIGAPNRSNNGFLELRVAMRAVENFFLAIEYEERARARLRLAKGGDAVGHDELLALHDSYRVASEVLMTNGETDKVARRSKDAIVALIVFCTIDAISVCRHPHVGRFGVPLNPADLGDFVALERPWVEAAKTVHAYLLKRTRPNQLFCLSRDSITWEFATQYARNCSAMTRLWLDEKEAMQARVDAHWNVVLQKQAEAKRLRQKIADLKSKIPPLEAEMSSAEKVEERLSEANSKVDAAVLEYIFARSDYSRTRAKEDEEHWRKQVQTRQAAVNALPRSSRSVANELSELRRTITTTEHELREAEKCPPAVYQPLPQQESKALAVIFFLYMPAELRSLAQSAFMAQQAMRPFQQFQNQPSYNESWSNYYNQKQNHNSAYHKPSKIRSGQDGAVKLHSTGRVPSELEITGTHVDGLRHPSDGVFYPDWDLKMSWRSNGTQVDTGTHLNPWQQIDRAHIVSHFTPSFGRPTYQKYMSIENDATRGNLGLAKQRDVPCDWTRQAWLSFSGLRAFPCLQFRRLAAALDNRELPLSDQLCQVLIQQTLAHLGEFDDQSGLLWRKDLQEARGLESLGRILVELCAEHRDAPGKVDEVPLVALLAGHFSQWWPELCKSCEDLAEATLEWAREHAERIPTSSQKDQPGLRKKICIFCHCTVLCCRFIPMTKAVACALGRAMVLFNHHSVFNEQGESASLSTMKNDLGIVLGARAEELLDIAQADELILTNTIGAVIDGVPLDTTWTRMGAGTSSGFRTRIVPGSENSYQVNLLNGIVLMNGYLPSRLPKAVRAHPLFKQVFGQRQFDVTMIRDAVFQTSFKLGGRLYEFSNRNRQVQIEEVWDDGRHLKLIDPALLSGTCLPSIPVQHYSQWMDNELLLFRPRHLQQQSFHNVSWILNWSNGECVRVPDHKLAESGENYRTLLSSASALEEQLVPLPASLKAVLSKFEDPKWIHCFTARSGASSSMPSFYFELPRYRLSFELRGDGKLWSKDYKGFFLAAGQQLSTTLPTFKKYLVLQKFRAHTEDHVRVLIPRGTVQLSDGVVTIQESVEQASGNEAPRCSVLRYDKHHRFATLEAESVVARLQLAAVYAAAGSISGDEASDMAGMEVAMDLVRSSWVNRPLRPEEDKALTNISMFTKGAPGLEALARELHLSSTQLGFLYEGTHTSRSYKDWRELAARCMQEDAEHRGNWRRRLTRDESLRLFHRSCSSFEEEVPEDQLVDVEACPGEVEIARAYEEKLSGMVQPVEVHTRRRRFPIRAKRDPSEIDSRMLKETKDSWTLSQDQLRSELQLAEGARDEAFYLKMLEEVRAAGEEKLKYVRGCLEQRPQAPRFQLSIRARSASGAAPIATLAELCRMTFDEDSIMTVNPYLSEKGRAELRKGLLQLLQIFVLQDKLLRLISFVNSGQDTALLQELQVRRVFDVAEHPKWLVFEVANGLQIRPVQVAVTNKFLQGSTGDIVQLNMGEGKTRVILPMLVLASASGQTLVRVTALQQLLEDLANHFQCCLTASPLNHKVYRMPFNRDVALNESTAQQMLHSMEHCRRVGGVMVVAPEHRLSFQLKRLELLVEKKRIPTLQKLDQVEIYDVLDESDEILSYVRQVIYAKGIPEDLPDGQWRWLVPQALLRALRQCIASKRLANLPDEAVSITESLPEAFGDIRFKPGRELNSIIRKIKEQVLKQLFDHPPAEFKWLEGYSDQLREALEEFALEADQTTADLPANLPKEHRATLLALRGYMAGGIFQRCLEKRCNVDFGLRSGGKRLAVPYRGSHTPSMRSEFAQADPALLLTDRSWYLCGLSEDQLLCTFKSLSTCSSHAQSRTYDFWFSSSSQRMPEDVRVSLNSWEKIDLSNTKQLRLLHEYFHLNFEVINRFLTKIVLPVETAQFPQKISANSWDLAEGKRVNGFSGTCRNLIPLHVQMAAVPELVSTDGRMIDLLTKNSSYLECPTSHFLDWLADLICDSTGNGGAEVRALVDCGAYTSRWSNEDFAQELLPKLSKDKFKGVVFFNTSQKDWVVLDHYQRQLPLHTSPIEASECFAFFDETRTRGADLRLAPSAAAALTLAPGMRKDSLMQGAGRMRLLGRSQSVLLVGTCEISGQIEATCEGLVDEEEGDEESEEGREGQAAEGAEMDVEEAVGEAEGEAEAEVDSPMSAGDGEIDSKMVLEWAFGNECSHILKAMPEFARQGATYLTTCGNLNPKVFVFKEENTLEGLFGDSFERKTVKDIIESETNKLHQREGVELKAREDQLFKRLQALGNDFVQLSGEVAAEEEQERELEKEVEAEQEKEVEVFDATPHSEKTWTREVTNMVLQSKSLQEVASRLLPRGLTVCRATDMVNIGQSDSWPQSVGCTQNFKDIVQQAELASDMRRLAEFILVLPNGDWLLLSPLEAQTTLLSLWQSRKAACTNSSAPEGKGAFLTSFRFLRRQLIKGEKATGNEETFPEFTWHRSSCGGVSGASNPTRLSTSHWAKLASTDAYIQQVVAVSILTAECRFPTIPLKKALDAAFCGNDNGLRITKDTVHRLLAIHRAGLLFESSQLSEVLMKCHAQLVQKEHRDLRLKHGGSTLIWTADRSQYAPSGSMTSPLFTISGLQDLYLQVYRTSQASDKTDAFGVRICGANAQTSMDVTINANGERLSRTLHFDPNDSGPGWRRVAEWPSHMKTLTIELTMTKTKTKEEKSTPPAKKPRMGDGAQATSKKRLADAAVRPPLMQDSAKRARGVLGG